MGKIRIISRNAQVFHNREEAGRLLGRELHDYRSKHAVVVGIPRGGIVVAREIAIEIEAEMDIILSRKLRTPGQPELAMGSVAEDGRVFLNDTVIREFSIGAAEIDTEKSVQMDEIIRRSTLTRRLYEKIPLTGRIVIITDDGVATGATTQAAIWAVRQEKPQYLIAAVPVGSEDSITRLAGDVDEMVCLCTPPFFMAVGQFYNIFEQVEDEDVLKILAAEQKRKSVARTVNRKNNT